MKPTLGLLTQAEAAEQLGIKPSTLEHWRLVGGGPKFVKVGRLVRYQLSALEAYLTARTRQSTSHRRIREIDDEEVAALITGHISE